MLGNNQNCAVLRSASLASILATGLMTGCGAVPGAGSQGIEPIYDQATGRLQQLRYDSDKNGRVDTVSYMDGSRVIRIEIDKDEDGRVERWEHYRPDRTLEKVGFSRASDGREDAWSFAGPDGEVVRIDISAGRDGRISRSEHYERGVLVRVEEDDDGDGRMDRWETYDGEVLASVAFDTSRRGSPDRRLVYGAGGGARLEHDPDGDGVYAPQP